MDKRLGSAPAKIRRWVILGATALLLSLNLTFARGQEEAAPAAPLGLNELLSVGLARQPALAAARASVSAAESGRYGLDTLPLCARMLAKDLPVRKEQACLGITIANAGLRQAEWETRYAVTRNYYSIQYARLQEGVIINLVNKLDAARKKAIKLVEEGDVAIKITKLDVDLLTVNLEFVKAKKAEATAGISKAGAALREALGVDLNYPLTLTAAPLPPLVESLNKQELVSMALANRGEMDQVASALRVTELEVSAQGRICLLPFAKTFASAADIHAQPIPQGVSNGDYRPGAIGLEMPANLAGNRQARMQRAQALSERAGAVVDKTHNLIQLEVEVIYLKWQEAAERTRYLANTPKMAGEIIKRVEKSFNEGNSTAEELLRARTLEDQARAQLNEALYHHALALAALERATAGGYRFPAGK